MPMYMKRGILEATYRIRVGTGTGTAVCVRKGDRLYFITAKHMFVDKRLLMTMVHLDKIVVCNCQHGVELPICDVDVYFPDGAADIAIFAIAYTSVFACIPFEALRIKGLILGEQVFLVGFPFVFNNGHRVANPDTSFYLPIVKSGFVAALDSENAPAILIDAHNNSGFSGGPVVMKTDISNGYVCGIISGYYFDEVNDQCDNRTNSGFTIVYSIQYAIQFIENIERGK